MSQKPLAFLLPLFGADQNLLTKRCMFGKGGVVGVNFTGVEVVGEGEWGWHRRWGLMWLCV